MEERFPWMEVRVHDWIDGKGPPELNHRMRTSSLSLSFV